MNIYQTCYQTALIAQSCINDVNTQQYISYWSIQYPQQLTNPHQIQNYRISMRSRGRGNKSQQPIKLEDLNDAHIIIEDQQPEQGGQNPFCYDEDEMEEVYQQQKQSKKNLVKIKLNSSDSQTRYPSKDEDVRVFIQQDKAQFQKEQQYIARIKQQFVQDKERLDRQGDPNQIPRIHQQSISLRKSLEDIMNGVQFKGLNKNPVSQQQQVIVDKPIELLKYEGIIPTGKFSHYVPSIKPEPFLEETKQKCKMSQKKLELIIKYLKKYEQFLKNKNSENQQKMSLKKFAIDIGLNPATIYQYYYDFLIDPTLSQKFMGIRQIARRNAANNVTLTRMSKLKQMIRVNPFITQNQMMDRLMAEPDCRGSQPYQLEKPIISRLLRSMNYSKKKILRIPKLKNTPINIQKRYLFSVEYKRMKQQQRAIIYYFDECAFNLFTMRDMAWSERGKPVEYKQATPISKNVSLSLIISSCGIQEWQLKKGTFKKHHIMLFLEKFFKKVQARGQLKYKQYLLFDNCPIHDFEQIKNLASKYCKMTMMLLPPYTPQMNPIETWFHDMKLSVRKGIQMTEDQLILQINKAVKKYKSYDFSNYYSALIVHAQRGIRKEKF